MKTLTVESEQEMFELGESLADRLSAGMVVALDGELGAGKTHLAKGIAAGLGYGGEVTSPTFSIVREYDAASVMIYHIDLYRVQSLGELMQSGLDEFLPSEDGISLVEWAGKFPDMIPGEALRISISIVAGDVRSVGIEGGR